MAIKKCSKKRKSRFKTGLYVSLKTGQICKYRSGWELLYLQYLDSQDDVVSWTYEPFHISYVSNKTTGKVRKYNPDIIVHKTDGTYLIEIKPSNKIKKSIIQKKIKAAESWCAINNMLFVIITEVELKALGLL